MTQKEDLKLFSVTDWKSYYLVKANSADEAVKNTYSKTFTRIDNSTLTDETVVHAMCCEYQAGVETILESMTQNIDRVLWLDAYPDTLRYQVTVE
ncbi:hypothetical protein FCU94_13480 [Vibrio sp. JPW-9-11-11]|uniref:hypothetical protein n=1 Tax=Vibrio sp. JPW-9-11-11 TaxID=1416532 RepID=UPI001592F944|nr:hypothetical protein [Vibrio sp. JPW-9-11-11]NVD07897.1 hypothetical protein [Vibrio sp. JPW-9-11-11]